MMHFALLSVLFAETVLPSIRQLHRTAHRLAMLGQARASNNVIWVGRVTGKMFSPRQDPMHGRRTFIRFGIASEIG